MENGLPGFGVLNPMRTHHIDTNRPREAEVERLGSLILTPNLDRDFLQGFLEGKGIYVNSNLVVADGVTDCESAYAVTGQTPDHFCFTPSLTLHPIVTPLTHYIPS